MLNLLLLPVGVIAARAIGRENGWLPAKAERLKKRRTMGRSEHHQTLNEQLDVGLEDSFPARDPPAVVSTAIARKSPRLVGTDEVLSKRSK